MEEIALLMGWPSVREHVRLVRGYVADKSSLDDMHLVREWRQANSLVKDMPPIAPTEHAGTHTLPLPAELVEVAESELASPVARRCFGLLPYHCSLVDIDRLICWQRYINTSFASRVGKTLPRTPSARLLFDFAFGRTRDEACVDVSPGPGANHYVFSSASSDLRVLDAVELAPDAVPSLEVQGRVAAIVAVAVGYSFNSLIALQMDNRLVLVNGTHRAYALRALGVTHVPCVIRRLQTLGDLDLVATLPGVSPPLEWYFTQPRPPLLRDFFDPRLTKVVRSRRNTHAFHLELKFTKMAVRAE